MPNTMVLLAALGALVAAGGALAFWLMRRGGGEGAGEYHHFRCPGCQRRLRYHRRQVGHKGECSNCKRELVFPPVSKARV
jgi:hypothetical protein